MKVTVVQNDSKRWEIEYRDTKKAKKRPATYHELRDSEHKVICVAKTIDDAITLLRLYRPSVEIMNINPCDRHSYDVVTEPTMLIDSTLVPEPLTKEEQDAIESFIADDKDSARALACKLLVRRLGS